MTNREYLSLCASERADVASLMQTPEFLALCNEIDPSYLCRSNGTAYNIAQQLLSEACRRIAYLEARLREADRIAEYAATLSDQAYRELEASTA
jgi:DNA-binding LacI/PurR family transcriptional regulator